MGRFLMRRNKKAGPGRRLLAAGADAYFKCPYNLHQVKNLAERGKEK
jgi:hypothetical protein